VRAVVFDRCGDPAEVLQIREVPRPEPKRGEVLVRMVASPINPSDLMYIQGVYGLKPSLPATPGFEGVGIVEASGGGLLGRFRKGKRVAVINDRLGNWSEHTVTTARQVVPVPSDIPDDQAAAFFVNPATAIAMTQHVLKIPRGETLLQTAAGSALGKMIIRLGRANGFRTANVVRRREQVEELMKLGADRVIVEEDGPLAEQLNERVRYAIDPVGGPTGTQAALCLGQGGRLLAFGALSGEPLRVDPRFLITTGASVEGFWLGSWMKRQSIPTVLGLFKQMRRLIREGVATTKIAKEYPMDAVAEAVRHAASDAKGGKILLRFPS
jgi:NADPH:quinone reductase-like Zn-dependent oxidoreductase